MENCPFSQLLQDRPLPKVIANEGTFLQLSWSLVFHQPDFEELSLQPTFAELSPFPENRSLLKDSPPVIFCRTVPQNEELSLW
jgi:hypothetical protein